jgi:predicted nucleic acid-binding protein
MIGLQKDAPSGKVVGKMAKPTELLFDTTALIDMYRGKDSIKPYFDSMLGESLMSFVCVITEAELWRGLRTEELERHELMMARFISIPLESEMARLAGAWMQKYASAGLGWMDAFISATGKIASVTVLTRDKRLATVLTDETKFEVYKL